MDQQKLMIVIIAQPARPPLHPMPRGLTMRLCAAFLMGLGGGLGLAVARELYFDRSFTTGEEIERRLGIPHIASIPDGSLAG
jgi:capsular polysaccharide biosynthesis protein